MASGDLTASTPSLGFLKCASFDGVDDNVLITTPNFYNEPFSCTAWIKLKQKGGADDYTIIDLGLIWGSEVGHIWMLEDDSSGNPNHQMFLAGQGSAISDTAITEGVWTHVGVVQNATTTKFYLNGVADGSTANDQEEDSGKVQSYIGAENATSNEFNGLIRDVQIYKKELTDAEMLQNYQGRLLSGLIHHYKLNDDYTDSVGSNDGTNSGSTLINTIPKKVLTQVSEINLGATTDDLIVAQGRAGNFLICGVERAA